MIVDKFNNKRLADEQKAKPIALKRNRSQEEVEWAKARTLSNLWSKVSSISQSTGHDLRYFSATWSGATYVWRWRMAIPHVQINAGDVDKCLGQAAGDGH